MFLLVFLAGGPSEYRTVIRQFQYVDDVRSIFV